MCIGKVLVNIGEYYPVKRRCLGVKPELMVINRHTEFQSILNFVNMSKSSYVTNLHFSTIYFKVDFRAPHDKIHVYIYSYVYLKAVKIFIFVNRLYFLMYNDLCHTFFLFFHGNYLQHIYSWIYNMTITNCICYEL